jgi:hypothetical protein
MHGVQIGLSGDIEIAHRLGECMDTIRKGTGELRNDGQVLSITGFHPNTQPPDEDTLQGHGILTTVTLIQARQRS